MKTERDERLDNLARDVSRFLADHPLDDCASVTALCCAFAIGSMRGSLELKEQMLRKTVAFMREQMIAAHKFERTL